ncbi:hypothetical protein [Paenibacillus lignilyticus]|uniref:MBL fold metallo-hydrolase n=1 Tax=Paenibacillus lignilyticus TaxID=1172615 RepID=A0ABS5CDG0_9BACL|nr:hypothetical protein [Paenibacillus lignilyticus]MBP3964030.1 hypothetical protein [Paenibacillus lignilyticus]
MTIQYEVQVKQVASFGQVPGPEVFWMSAFDRWLPLITLMGVIRGGGKTILINSGPPLDFVPAMNASWLEFFKDERARMTVTEEQQTLNVLRAMGISPEEVDYVVVTPLQAYAIGNVDLFPNATICLSKRGWIDFHAPKHPDPRRDMAIPSRILTHLVVDAWREGRVRLLEDEETLLPGLHIWYAGTHHRSSMAVNVQTHAGTVIFSDCMFYYDNVEKNHPLGILENLEECHDAYARIRKEAAVIVPLYDPAVLERHPDGCVSRA